MNDYLYYMVFAVIIGFYLNQKKIRKSFSND
jgi:uncharacterized protein YneF (UPF0154 family)